MAEMNPPTISRGFSKTDGQRMIVVIALLAVVGPCYWFALPLIQSLIIPAAPGGTDGPWILRPILAFHFGAVAVMCSVTVAAIVGLLRKRWKRDDVAMGSTYDPFRDQPIKRVLFVLKGALLLLIYAGGLVLYLGSWTVIGPAGIDEHLPWTTRHHSFQEILSLQHVPDGHRSEAYKQNGPWYRLGLPGDRSIWLGLDNEGTTRDDLAAVAGFVAKRTGLSWVMPGDTRVR